MLVSTHEHVIVLANGILDYISSTSKIINFTEVVRFEAMEFRHYQAVENMAMISDL